jgi:formate hydrogenlyase subunit 4
MTEELANIIIKYHSDWRVGLFTASITLASFLFTMKSFVIQTIKEKIYDKKSYKDKVKQRRDSESVPKTEYYGALKRLSFLLKWTILIALINAIFQLTLSYFSSPWFAVICLVTSAVTALLFFVVVWIVSENINDFISNSEAEAQDSE